MKTYATPEEAIDSLLKPELVNGGLNPETYDLNALSEEVLYDHSEGSYGGPEEGFGLHPELSFSTLLEIAEEHKKTP